MALLGQGTLDRPSTANALKDGLSVDAEFSRPVTGNLRFSVVCYQACIAFIAMLFGRCRPSRVAGFVITVTVLAIQCVGFGWSGTEISKESLKRVSPFIADADATPTVPWVVLHRRIGTSPYHGAPCAVLLSGSIPVLSRPIVAVFCEGETSCLRASLALIAPATRARLFGDKCVSPDITNSSALASTLKPRASPSVAWLWVSDSGDCPSTKCVSDLYSSWIHIRNYSVGGV